MLVPRLPWTRCAEEEQVLVPQGLVEPELLAQRRDPLGGRGLPEDGDGRVARQQMRP